MDKQIAQAVAQAGGRAYYVGGCVRDRIMGRESKDIDIEVHGLEPAALERILDQLGDRLEMGASFGVYGLRGQNIDIAMPRRETATGRGHRDFRVDVDPFLGTEKAALRRDFTVNAMMADVLTGEIIDHFGGQRDLEQGILRHVNEASFAEDALRVLRGAQFAARFGFRLAPETVALCRRMDLTVLPRERVLEEVKKALLQAPQPSVFFEVLREMNQLSVWFPELEALIGVEQNPRFHAEGDVWNHTMLVLDEAAQRRQEAEQPLGLMLAALCHDLGKAVCSEKINGVIHAYDHENRGIPLAGQLLSRLTGEKGLHRYVENMVQLHMKPNRMAQDGAGVKSTNKLFDQAKAPGDLILLAQCDSAGSRTGGEKPDSGPWLRQRLGEYLALRGRPAVTGEDLIRAGLQPGPEFREVLSYAHKLHLAGVEKESALRQALGYARGRNKK